MLPWLCGCGCRCGCVACGYGPVAVAVWLWLPFAELKWSPAHAKHTFLEEMQKNKLTFSEGGAHAHASQPPLSKKRLVHAKRVFLCAGRFY